MPRSMTPSTSFAATAATSQNGSWHSVLGPSQTSLALDFSGETNPVEVEIAANRSGFFGSVVGNVSGAGPFANVAQLSVIMTQLWDFASVEAAAFERPASLFLDAGEAPDDEDWLQIDLRGVRNAAFETNPSGAVFSHYGTFLNFERFSVTLGPGTNRVRTGSGDDRISSIGIDTIDGGAGVDSWTGIYTANRTGLSFRMEGTSASLSNGTTIVNVEAYSIVAGAGRDSFEFINPTTDEFPQIVNGGGGFDTLFADLTESTRDTAAFNIRSTGERGYSGSFGGDLVDLSVRDIEALELVLGNSDSQGTVHTGSISRNGGSLAIDGGGGFDTVVVPFLRSGYSIVSEGNGGFIIDDIDRSNGDTGWFEVRNFEVISFADQTVDLVALQSGPAAYEPDGWSSFALLQDLGALALIA
jgi:hypothetical protein